MTWPYKHIKQNNTKVVVSDDSDWNTVARVMLHDSMIVLITKKHVFLWSKGWLTRTTKDRLNAASKEFNLRYRVFQKKLDWFVEYDGKVIPFEEGMKLERR